jgi:hypothetical protein
MNNKQNKKKTKTKPKQKKNHKTNKTKQTQNKTQKQKILIFVEHFITEVKTNLQNLSQDISARNVGLTYPCITRYCVTLVS